MHKQLSLWRGSRQPLTLSRSFSGISTSRGSPSFGTELFSSSSRCLSLSDTVLPPLHARQSSVSSNLLQGLRPPLGGQIKEPVIDDPLQVGTVDVGPSMAADGMQIVSMAASAAQETHVASLAFWVVVLDIHRPDVVLDLCPEEYVLEGVMEDVSEPEFFRMEVMTWIDVSRIGNTQIADPSVTASDSLARSVRGGGSPIFGK